MKQVKTTQLFLTLVATVVGLLLTPNPTYAALDPLQKTKSSVPTKDPRGLTLKIPPLRLGSWAQSIKTNSVSWQDDVCALVQALHGTGQNFCIYPIDENLDWTDLTNLLRTLKTEGTDIRVLGAIGNPNLGGGANGQNRWFSHSYSEGITDGSEFTNAALPVVCNKTEDMPYADYYLCQQDVILRWLDAWKNAARCLSALSTTYPNLTGYVINDFDSYVESVDFPACLYGEMLTTNQVGEIAEAARSGGNTSFQFWPTCYYENFGRVIGKGYVLGADYGVKLFTDDEMWVKLTFDVTSWPLWAMLRFLHHDTTDDCSNSSVFKEVFVNGVEDSNRVWAQRLIGTQHVEYFQQNIADYLNPNKKNTIYLRLAAESGTSNVTLEQARERCRDYNDNRTPAQISRGTKMEFEKAAARNFGGSGTSL